ncbi:hypothetical protein LA52FAK_32930 [Desulforhopalus sp. 52FAK]
MFEYIDTKRNRDPYYFEELRELWKIKYHSVPVDLIIVCDNQAYDFVLQERNGLFLGVPIVFAAYIGYKPHMLTGKQPVTGVIQETDITATIDVALHLHPQTKKIVFVAPGAPAFRMVWLEGLEERYLDRVELITVTAENINQIDKEIDSHGKDIVIIPLNSFLESDGAYFPFDQFVSHLSLKNSYPVYALWDIAIGHGVVGGKMVTGESQGRRASQLALQILQGTPISDVPVETNSPNQYMFDWQAMQRFKISENDLPENSSVINRPVSFYAENKMLVHGTIITVLLLLLLILSLCIAVIHLHRTKNNLLKAERTLKESEEQFRKMIEKSPLPMVVTDEAQDISFLNDKFTELFGYTVEDVSTAQMWWMKVYPNPEYRWEVQQSWSTAIEKARVTGQDIEMQEWELTCKDGALRKCEFYMVPLKNLSLIIMNDISERKKADEELVQSKTQLRSLVDSIPDIVWLKDPEGIYLSCNQKFEMFFGAKEFEIIGKSDYDFVDKSLADFFRYHDQEAIKADTPSVNEEQLTFSDGYCGLFETIKTPMRAPGGELIGVLGIGRDITARKKVEEALIQNERRYLSAQRMGLVGNWEFDLVTETFWGSDQAKVIYGFDPETDRFTTEDVEKCIPERDRVHQALIDLIEKDKPYNLEFEISPVSGPKTKSIKSIAELIKDDQGVPIKVAGVVLDVTSQKEALKEKLLLEKQLLQSQKMESIGNLAGGIAHDFNNILSAIIGFTELALEASPEGSSQKADLNEVYLAGIRAKELVQQILAFARKSETDSSPVRLSDIVTEVFKLLRPSTPTSVDIKVNINSTAKVMGNSSQLHQIVMNLCTNSIHSLQKTGGLVEVGLRDIFVDQESAPESSEGNAGEYVELTVTDNGPGIDQDIIDNIFEPYFTTKGVGEGTGMGLAMVKGIIDGSGGEIKVKSELGKETSFILRLPVVADVIADIEHKTDPVALGEERILFVDDELPVARMGNRMLETLGYIVTTQTSSIEALELFKEKPHSFDLVITDMTMPSMTGDMLSKELRNIREDIPIILCTGYSNEINDEGAKEQRIDAFAYKPLNKSELARIIRDVLDTNR